MSNQSWPEVNLEELFTLNTDGIAPNAAPKTEFHHHSLPAWDELGGPELEKGSSIESNKTKVTKPCVLVSKLNPRKPRVSVVESVPDEEHHCASTEFVCLEPKADEPLNFWGHLFSNKSFSDNLDRIAIGSTNSHKRYSPKELLSQRIELPPVPERRLIARTLDTLDTQIHKAEALIAKLEKVKEGLLHDLLTRGIDENGRLRPSPEQAPELYKESPLGWIPREWLITEIVSICKLGRGRVISQSCLEAYPGPYPVYSSQTKNGGVFGRIDSFDFEGPHVTWTTDGANAGTVTYREGRFNCTNVCGTLEARNETIHMPFLAWTLDRLTDRYVSRVGNDKLMNNVVAKMPVQVPSKHEQVRCTESLEPIENRIQHEVSSLAKIKAQKTALMDDLLTGRVRVTPLLDQAQATTPA